MIINAIKEGNFVIEEGPYIAENNGNCLYCNITSYIIIKKFVNLQIIIVIV